MPYRLKKNTEAFQVVDGTFAGRKYEHGKDYADADIPPQEIGRFEKMPDMAIQSPEKKEGGSRKGDEIPFANKGGKKS